MSIGTVAAPTDAAAESQAPSKQATRSLAQRQPGAGQAVLGVSCPSPEDVRKADEAAAPQRQWEQELLALHLSDHQPSMLSEADPQGKFLIQWLLHSMSSVV